MYIIDVYICIYVCVFFKRVIVVLNKFFDDYIIVNDIFFVIL